MNATELRALQAPWKEKYRGDPESARALLTARGRVNLDDLTCSLEHSGPDLLRTGMHPLAGGDGAAACAAEMLLQALVGCAGVTLAAVCTALEIRLDAAEITAQGELDFRGTLGVDRHTPVGFQMIRLQFGFRSPDEDEKLNKAVELAERFCVVAQSVRNIRTEWSRIS